MSELINKINYAIHSFEIKENKAPELILISENNFRNLKFELRECLPFFGDRVDFDQKMIRYRGTMISSQFLINDLKIIVS
jgi:hypothetical protein